MRDDKLKDDTMNIRMISAAGLMLALAGCTSIPSIPTVSPPSSQIEQRWVGESAGRFFASYGPPIDDHDEGGGRVYSWRGGYKTVHVPAKYAAGENGKKGRPIAPARTLYLSCKADISTSSTYVIRSIHVIGDMPGVDGPSYCAELLAPAKS